MDETKLNELMFALETKSIVWREAQRLARVAEHEVRDARQEFRDTRQDILDLIAEDLDTADRLTWGYWDCEKSPIKKCVYNVIEDPAEDQCLFCGDPAERK